MSEIPAIHEVETWFDDGDTSVAYIVINGVNRASINRRSTTDYEVVGGNGVFHIEGRSFPVSEGEIVSIPPGTIYGDEGDLLMMVATSSPAFRVEDVFMDS